jgi:hypothetical protein
MQGLHAPNVCPEEPCGNTIFCKQSNEDIPCISNSSYSIAVPLRQLVSKVQETLGGLDRVESVMDVARSQVSQVSVKPWLNSLPVVGRIWEIAED